MGRSEVGVRATVGITRIKCPQNSASTTDAQAVASAQQSISGSYCESPAVLKTSRDHFGDIRRPPSFVVSNVEPAGAEWILAFKQF